MANGKRAPPAPKRKARLTVGRVGWRTHLRNVGPSTGIIPIRSTGVLAGHTSTLLPVEASCVTSATQSYDSFSFRASGGCDDAFSCSQGRGCTAFSVQPRVVQDNPLAPPKQPRERKAKSVVPQVHVNDPSQIYAQHAGICARQPVPKAYQLPCSSTYSVPGNIAHGLSYVTCFI